MNVRDIMSKRVESIPAGESIALAAMTMKSLDVGCLPVVDSGELVGIVTDRDIVIRAIAEGQNPQGTAVRDVMTPGCLTIPTEASTDECARVMRDARVHRIIAVEDGKLVGIVSTGDLAQQDTEASARALEGITRS